MGYGLDQVHESMRAAVRDRARLLVAPPGADGLLPDGVYVHPRTVEEVMMSPGFGVPGKGGQMHGDAVVLFGVAVIPTTQVLVERCVWVWHTPALRPGPPHAAA